MRSASVIGPMRDAGGAIHARSVTVGLPLASSIDTSASPTASSVIARRDVELRIRPQRVGGGLHRLLIARREGAQRVLHAVAELSQHRVGDVGRALGDEVDADALRSDQPHDLLDLLDQRRRRVGEQQVRFVEEEHQRRLVGIADLRQPLEQLRQHPEQEDRVELRRPDQLVGRQDVDHAAALAVGLQQIVDVEHRLAEERRRRPAARPPAATAESRRSTPPRCCRTWW